MMRGMRSLFVGASLSIGSPLFASAAPEVTVYSFEKVPDIHAIVQKDGNMYAAFGAATVSDAINTFSKLLKLDLNSGKPQCAILQHVELGMNWFVKPCLTTTFIDEGRGTFAIRAVIKFEFPPDDGVDITDFLKENDFVKERRFTLHFSPAPLTCSVTITKRTYIPVDGRKPVPSRTGPGVCLVKHR
ncbi:hypothetical protein [Ensifer aridi]|uniref:hypothetical protein n=1 Tax=Ensifer aridi TaxID=1708715 RepID=UPI001124D8DE|nr:hypothetical protein [Ensifer aridi]